MCLDNYRLPTEEEKNKKYIGYKIVQKTKNSNEFIPEILCNTGIKYVIGEITEAELPEEIDYENHGIHIYLNSEVEKYLFGEKDYLALIKVEFEGEDILAFGENSHRYRCLHRRLCPYSCQHPCLYTEGCTVKKVKVVEEVKWAGPRAILGNLR